MQVADLRQRLANINEDYGGLHGELVARLEAHVGGQFIEQDVPPEPAAGPQDIRRLRKAELQVELRARGLGDRGLKNDLIQRLFASTGDYFVVLSGSGDGEDGD